MSAYTEVIQDAARLIAISALDLFVADAHRFSDRPCGTCERITRMLGEPWGCSKLNGYKP